MPQEKECHKVQCMRRSMYCVKGSALFGRGRIKKFSHNVTSPCGSTLLCLDREPTSLISNMCTVNFCLGDRVRADRWFNRETGGGGLRCFITCDVLVVQLNEYRSLEDADNQQYSETRHISEDLSRTDFFVCKAGRQLKREMKLWQHRQGCRTTSCNLANCFEQKVQ